MNRPRLLVNLPSGFYRTPSLGPRFERLAARFDVVRTSHDTPDQIRPDLAEARAVLMWSWPALDDALLDAAPHLEFAAHLDLTQRAARTALARGLPVSVARSAFSPAVAEMALTLILAGLRRTSDHHAAMRAGTEAWVGSFPDDIDPRERELTGRAVGIVGYGRIGRRLHELLGPFRCDVRVADPFVPADGIRAAGAAPASVAELCAACDVVVLCAASNEGTRQLVGAAEIAALPADAVLVNVARAALVDGGALRDRLAQGDLVAAIDVFDQEPLPGDDPLRRMPNALLTPHRAGGLMASVHRILDGLADDLEAHFDGRPTASPLTEAMVPALDA